MLQRAARRFDETLRVGYGDRPGKMPVGRKIPPSSVATEILEED
jgi:hypothetical protein